MQKKVLGNSLDFDRVYEEVLVDLFSNIADSRRDNSKYSLVDALKSGFAIYSLKSPSLFSFRQRSKAESSNLKSVYGIKEIPSDNGLRKILDSVSPDALSEGFSALFNRVESSGLLASYRYWQDHLLVSIDGVEHYCSKQISCPHCMVRNHRDGSSSYYHSMLSAALVCPDQSEVFVLENEPIVKQDGTTKNDCERNAAKRLFTRMQQTHHQESIVYLMDALYACGPIIRQLIDQPNWRYVIGVTEKGNKALLAQFDQANAEHRVHWQDFETTNGKYTIGYLNNLQLNESSPDIQTNLLYCIWKNNKGEEKVFSWVSNIKLTKANVMKIMRMGRARWKIENEVFNTLKNQQYHFEHNFGHGQKHLCTNFAFLMMLAFTLDQIQQRANRYFRTLIENLKTKVKLWEAVRAVFKILPCKNMKQVYLAIADLYQIKLE